jgi:imidazole glycerol phosphate synthase glutamine amidotransferase subunit
VLATGVANVASVLRLLGRLGAESTVTEDPDEAAKAPRAVLPGVGSFRAGMEALERSGLAPAVRARALEGRPLLAICLGTHLLGEGSDESPGVAGLGVFPARARRLEAGRVPHMGWNDVEAGAVAAGTAYFAHSYAFAQAPDGWEASHTEAGGARFVSALRRGAVLAVQFHPELSGEYGLGLVRSWLEGPC